MQILVAVRCCRHHLGLLAAAGNCWGLLGAPRGLLETAADCWGLLGAAGGLLEAHNTLDTNESTLWTATSFNAGSCSGDSSQEAEKDKKEQRVTIWRMSCLVASEAVHKYMCKVLPGPEVARRYQRFYAGGFDRFLEPTVIAMQPKVQIENLEFCRLSEAGQHGLIGLKSSEDQAVEKQQGEFQSFQQTLHSEVRSWKAYLIAKSEHEDEAASHQTSAKDGVGKSLLASVSAKNSGPLCGSSGFC